MGMFTIYLPGYDENRLENDVFYFCVCVMRARWGI